MIADPMADLGSGPAQTGGGPGSNDMGSTTKDVFDPMAMAMNMQRIDRIKNVMGIVAGCVAGICGLTGFSGFGTLCILIGLTRRSPVFCTYTDFSTCSLLRLVCFALWHLFVCVVIWSTKMSCNLSAYTRQSWFVYVTTGAQQFALSFTLFWTLFYGLVYLY